MSFGQHLHQTHNPLHIALESAKTKHNLSFQIQTHLFQEIKSE